MGAARADSHWPPGGDLPDDAPRGRLGYAANPAVAEAASQLEIAQADFVFLQLDEVDTERHLRGADLAAVADMCRATDAALGEILEPLRTRWSDVVVIAVSDHDHESIARGAVDLAAATRERGLDVVVEHDGTAAVVVGEVDRATLASLPGVADSATLGADVHLVWGEAGTQFGIDWGLAAHHGSPRTRRQLAVVGGGHAAAKALADRIRRRAPTSTDWAAWIAESLGLGARH